MTDLKRRQKVNRGVRIVLVTLAALFTALMWSGLSLQDVVSAIW
jgi:hypothetical protein